MGVKWRGYYKALALYLLASKPLSGYEIIKTLEGAFGGRLRPSPGTIYPLLRYLEEEGYIKAEEQYVGRKRKRVYSVTEAGRRALEQYLKDQTFMGIIEHLRRGGGEPYDIVSSIAEEVRFLSEIFEEVEGADEKGLRDLYEAVSEFKEKIARRLGAGLT